MYESKFGLTFSNHRLNWKSQRRNHYPNHDHNLHSAFTGSLLHARLSSVLNFIHDLSQHKVSMSVTITTTTNYNDIPTSWSIYSQRDTQQLSCITLVHNYQWLVDVFDSNFRCSLDVSVDPSQRWHLEELRRELRYKVGFDQQIFILLCSLRWRT